VTTIVAVQGPSWAVVGFDSQVTEEGGRSYTLGRGSSKVVKNGPYLLGAAGDVRAINILAYAFTPPKPGPITGIRLDRFVTSKFVPACGSVLKITATPRKKQKNKRNTDQLFS
jgi:hypothetical protein